MKLYTHIATELEQFNAMVKNINENKNSLVVGVSQIHKAHFAYASAVTIGKCVVVITEDEASARVITDDINAMNGENIAAFYPPREFNLRQSAVSSREFEQIRLGVLSRIQADECSVIVASIEAVMQHTIPPQYLKERSFTLKRGNAYKLDELVKSMLLAGYEPKPQVEGICQFSRRGGIIDVFPPSFDKPVRIEFWGDDIDTMAMFDIETQRRTEDIDQVNITPANEVLMGNKEELELKLTDLISGSKNKLATDCFKRDLEQVKAGIPLNSMDKYIALCYDKPATLLDYVGDAVVFVSEYAAIKERCKNYQWQQEEDLKILLEEGELCSKLIRFEQSLIQVVSRISANPLVLLDTFTHTNRDIKVDNLISINPIQTSAMSGEIKLLCEDVAPLIEQGYAVIVLAGTKKAAEALCHDLKKQGLPAMLASENSGKLSYKKVMIAVNNLSSGFEYPEIKVNIITIGRQGESKQRSARFKKGKALRSLTDLSEGDLVVHITHGIGVFKGVNKLEMQGIVKDYIKIGYAGSDMLYVPVTQLDLVSKYIGPRDDGKVKLNRLNSTDWQKTRSRVKKAVAEMADELIKLYAERMQAKGFAYSVDSEWQKDFEQHFPYIETDDQLRSVEEIKADMEKGSPMDRVLCGDVGFGKTEVAMRACFKAVMDTKQVAILCPTTILAWQHYQSFVKRFEPFPVNVEVLSRFRTPKQQKEILKRLKEGRIDIIIGTHRLVQKDIDFKDLGLAIVDEEQRFGVAHKERFKEMFTDVDMLTLSATPIPRTLNMAISGIRDMSTIEQPPQDRHPVQSYVIEYEQGIIMEAIRKELRRGGQVYYIYNKIDTIEQCAGRIQQAIPEARIAVAHGRMDEREITDIWRKLIEHEIDVLVCTTIIETGVDVANCNTLVIENADHMGLSQLYQLRGRVGRSSRRAYAYFTFKPGKVLTEIATKRLNAIREFTKFGSGFRIAMRDLEIRGAGSLLGSRQHGHMEAVGYDMYIRLLSEAIEEKKGNAPSIQSHECVIDLRLDAHIPDEYIESLANRIDIYRRIASIKSSEDAMDVTDELIDRFGEPPSAVTSLIEVGLLRNRLAMAGFNEIKQKANGLMLYTPALDMGVCERIISALKGRVLVNAGQNPYITIRPVAGKKIDPIESLKAVADAL